jgi:hypothetical protein
MDNGYILWSFGTFLECCTKKDLATLLWERQFDASLKRSNLELARRDLSFQANQIVKMAIQVFRGNVFWNL